MAFGEITVRDLAALGTGIRLIDVREAHEWDEIRVPHATHVPLSTVPDHLDLFDGEPTYVICKVGGRSAHACEYAADHGVAVVNVEGGMMAWCAADLTVTGGAIDA